MYAGHSGGGALLTQLFLGSFPFHAALMAAGERLTAPVGLTAARWQVLSAVARAERPMTVAAIARQMGLTRQAVQRLAGELVAGGFAYFCDNPQHKRARLLSLTPQGRSAFADMVAAQVPWVNALASRMDLDQIRSAVAVLSQLTIDLEQSARAK